MPNGKKAVKNWGWKERKEKGNHEASLERRRNQAEACLGTLCPGSPLKQVEAFPSLLSPTMALCSLGALWELSGLWLCAGGDEPCAILAVLSTQGLPPGDRLRSECGTSAALGCFWGLGHFPSVFDSTTSFCYGCIRIIILPETSVGSSFYCYSWLDSNLISWWEDIQRK